MNIHKTSGNISGKIAPETSAQKAMSKAVSAQIAARAAKSAAKTSSSATQSALRQTAMRSVSSIISAAGLPADKLSASIISFARFFSLPLKPELLKNIRQQAFTMTPNATSSEPVSAADSAHETGTILKNREALSLAASAAQSKGVELKPEGLEAYAQAVDPEWRERQDSGQRDQRGRRNKNDNEKDETPSQKTAAITAGSLEKNALEYAQKNPLLAILNRLPEKDGKRWIVLPFDFSDNDREFKVSLRILLETGKTVNRAGCMALDIAAHNTVESGKAEMRQLFVLEPANRLSVYLQPEITQAEQVSLVRDLSALLEINPERIFVKTLTESFPFEADCGDDLLRSIDEAV